MSNIMCESCFELLTEISEELYFNAVECFILRKK